MASTAGPVMYVPAIKSGAAAKKSESPTDLMAQGAANGINAVIGAKGGEPPAASPGLVLVDSGAAQAAIAGTSTVSDNAIIVVNGANRNGPTIEDGKRGKHQPGYNNFT
jgi:filamentous hemagglutinin